MDSDQSVNLQRSVSSSLRWYGEMSYEESMMALAVALLYAEIKVPNAVARLLASWSWIQSAIE
jgi:hypothetical protein